MNLPQPPFNLPPGCSLSELESTTEEKEPTQQEERCEDCGEVLNEDEADAGLCICCANRNDTPKGAEARAIIGAEVRIRSRERRLLLAGWYYTHSGTIHPPRKARFQ